MCIIGTPNPYNEFPISTPISGEKKATPKFPMILAIARLLTNIIKKRK